LKKNLQTKEYIEFQLKKKKEEKSLTFNIKENEKREIEQKLAEEEEKIKMSIRNKKTLLNNYKELLDNQIKLKKKEEFMSDEERKINKSLLLKK
jgi:hypothetical protein